ncbi:hypothetical protein AX769_10780 [Frondihabitans sp. PAMC 28766]|nr:hypothetical protein AX769_10780 [Frondihabitans sp. PAMC 28766]
MRRNAVIALSGAAAVALVVAGAVLAPQSASAYPSWSDVQAAKGNAQATKTQVDAITSALTSLRTEAAAKSTAAIKADAANAQAQDQLAAASSAASALEAQVAAQKKKADEAHQEAGQLAAHLYRIGSSSQLDSQLFDGKTADSTLYKLGALSQLSTQWKTVLDQATVASKAVSSLSAQATVAEKQRNLLAGKAKVTLAAAQSAQATADGAVSSATTHQATLDAQLATLDKTAAVELAGYNHGVVLARAAALAQEKARAAAAAKLLAEQKAATPPPSDSGASIPSSGSGGSPSGSGGSTSTGSGGNLGTGVVDDPAGAQSYASSQLGSHGWASSQMSCLVSLWNQESGWRTDALNVSSGAYGIPQSLPANKMAGYGLDWQTNYRTQINWGLAYIASAYGSPCGAWAHEVSHNWY